MRIILSFFILLSFKLSYSTPMVEYLNKISPSVLDFGLYKIEQELILKEERNLKYIKDQIGYVAEYNHIAPIINKKYEEELKDMYGLLDKYKAKGKLGDFFKNEMRIEFSNLINVGINPQNEMFFYSDLNISAPYAFQYSDFLDKNSINLLREFDYSDFVSIFDDDLETMCKAIRYSIMSLNRLSPFPYFSPLDGLSDLGDDFRVSYDFRKTELSRTSPSIFWRSKFTTNSFGITPEEFVENSDVIFSVLINYYSPEKRQSIICYGKNTETSVSFKKGGYQELDYEIFKILGWD